MIESVWIGILKTSEWMRQYKNKKGYNIEILVDAHAWLSIDYLNLPTNLLWKLSAKFVGPYLVVAVIGPIAFHLEVPPEWKLNDIFYVS